MQALRVVGCLGAAIALTERAQAQSAAQELEFFRAQTLIAPTIPSGYDRGGNISVDALPRPGFDPLPVQVGSFDLYPALSTYVGFSSNVLLSKYHPKADLLVGAQADIAIAADWGTSNFSLNARDWQNEWVNDPLRSQNQGNIDVSYQRDVTHSISAAVEGAYFSYADNNPIGTINYLDNILLTTHKTFGALKMEYQAGHISEVVSLDVSNYNIGNIDTPLTGFETNYYSDHSVYRLTSQTEYAFTPSTALFGQLNIYKSHYPSLLPGNLPNYDSISYRALFGFSLDLPGILRGQVSAGFAHRSYDYASYRTPTEFVVATKVEFFPDRRNNVTLAINRDFDDGSLYALTPVKYFTVTLTYVREIRKNILGGLQFNSFNQTALGQNQSSFSLYNYGGAVYSNYFVNRHLSLKFELGYERYINNTISGYGVDNASNHETRGQVTVTFKP